jgi:eukaryotic-like serine/threonine-protein kinase
VNVQKIHVQRDIVGERYAIIRFIGEGGMQEVYEAKDLSLARNVALKVPKNPSAMKRFNRSAVVSARVNHPNIAKTLDYLEEGENYYLIEELIVGKNLQEGLLQEVKILDPYLVAKIFHYLARGLAASHHAGVFHRDLKPDNVMIVGGFDLVQVKITDFGIAKMAEAEIANALVDDTSTLASSTAVGAIPYMAPEMFDRDRNPDQPADIWALGALMYEALSGKKPFGSGLQAVPSILSKRMPQLPSCIGQNQQFKPLGEEIYQLILKCLNHDSEERLTADQLVEVCEGLCYPVVRRRIGIFHSKPEDKNFGFIRTDDGRKIFFHFASIYGEVPKIGDRVCFSA